MKLSEISENFLKPYEEQARRDAMLDAFGPLVVALPLLVLILVDLLF